MSATQGELGGVPVVTVETPGLDPSFAVLYFHGGAYALGSAPDSVGLAADVARRVGARAISVDYRLAPEHPFPAAIDDAVAAYRALLDAGVPSERIAFVGESAGGGLVAATLRRPQGRRPAAARLGGGLLPVGRPDRLRSQRGQQGRGRPRAHPGGPAYQGRDYLGDRDPPRPLASPIFADLTGLPPLLIQVGSHEILLDDAVRLAARAGGDDVPVELQVWPGVPHVFQSFAAILDDADRR